MDIKISENLIKLAESMDKPLYIVGGYVRDYFLGMTSDDIDICSSLSYEEMVKICKKLKFRTNIVNKRLGTILIMPPKGDEHFEYTPFRVENYVNGKHSPEDVEFVDDISIDAKRRDFSMNSIYLNVLTKEIYDPYCGIKDIEKKVVRAVETPEKVFSSDGLRILRLVRFATLLGFKIDRKTLKIAKEMTYQLRDISAERKKKELDLMLANSKYGVEKNNCVKFFNDINIYKYLFMLPLNKYKVKLNNDYKKVFELPEEYRFIGFIVLFLFNKYNYENMPDSQVVFDVQNILGNALKCSNMEKRQVLNSFRVLQDLKYKELNVFMARNYHDLSAFEKKIVNLFVDVKPVSLMILNLHQSGVPLNEKELNISSEKIGQLVGEKYIAKVKQLILEGCLMGRIINTEEEIVKFIKTYFK